MRARREVTFSIGGLTVQARRLAAVIAGLALCLIALGGYVRGTDAGLSCPDWPLCYGRAVPDTAVPGVFQEVGHRYLASLVSFGVLLFSALAFRRRRELPRVWSACRIAVLVLLIQICLGGLTVLLKLNPFIVTAHLAMGTVMFQLFARLAVERAPRARGEEGLEQVFRPTESSRPLLKRYRALRLGLKLLVTAVSLQILLGGFLGSSGAALSCPELPLCFDRIFPTDMGPQPAIHMLHRLVAVAVLLIAVAVALTARTALRKGSKVMRLFLGIVFMVAVQLALGVSNVIWMVPVGIAVLHLVVAQGILFLSVHTYCKLALRFSRAEGSLYATSRDLDRFRGDEMMHYPVKRKFVANY